VDPFHTALVDCFRHGEVPRDVQLLAARGSLTPSAPEALSLLMLLVSDSDAEVAALAQATIARLPRAKLATFLAGADTPADVREFYAAQAGEIATPAQAADATPFDENALRLPSDGPLESASGQAAADTDVPGAPAGDTAADIEADPERRGAAQRLAMLTVAERMKVAMQGTREERSILIRDPNRLVSSSVLSSPKLTESEVEAIARMTNVSIDVLRVVGSSRVWLKSYSVVASLTRNAKTPVPLALNLLNRLTERDVKALSTDRNIPEPVRLAARKIYTRGVSRKQ